MFSNYNSTQYAPNAMLINPHFQHMLPSPNAGYLAGVHRMIYQGQMQAQQALQGTMNVRERRRAPG
jgi:hypothetical protein